MVVRPKQSWGALGEPCFQLIYISQRFPQMRRTNAVTLTSWVASVEANRTTANNVTCDDVARRQNRLVPPSCFASEVKWRQSRSRTELQHSQGPNVRLHEYRVRRSKLAAQPEAPGRSPMDGGVWRRCSN